MGFRIFKVGGGCDTSYGGRYFRWAQLNWGLLQAPPMAPLLAGTSGSSLGDQRREGTRLTRTLRFDSGGGDSLHGPTALGFHVYVPRYLLPSDISHVFT